VVDESAIRGINKPLLVEFRSKIELGSATNPEELIATFCEEISFVNTTKTRRTIKHFIKGRLLRI